MNLRESLCEVERHVARSDYPAALDILIGLRDDPELHPVVIREVVMPRLAEYRIRAKKPVWARWFGLIAPRRDNV